MLIFVVKNGGRAFIIMFTVYLKRQIHFQCIMMENENLWIRIFFRVHSNNVWEIHERGVYKELTIIWYNSDVGSRHIDAV